jgi:hypothetical protein
MAIASEGVTTFDVHEFAFATTWAFMYTATCIWFYACAQGPLILPYSIALLLYFGIYEFSYGRLPIKTYPLQRLKAVLLCIIASFGFVCVCSVIIAFQYARGLFGVQPVLLVLVNHLAFTNILTHILKKF